ncbi:hypothetical protein GCM10009863_19150 [Streptomyces axinellae]|uniref:Uncharacterized protein n=1 Tax=Streptomyces axinellae TaxID=552788 RepID=A0ABN3PWH5_9ACTN
MRMRQITQRSEPVTSPTSPADPVGSAGQAAIRVAREGGRSCFRHLPRGFLLAYDGGCGRTSLNTHLSEPEGNGPEGEGEARRGSGVGNHRCDGWEDETGPQLM